MRIATVGLPARLRRAIARQFPGMHISTFNPTRAAPQQHTAEAPYATIYLLARDHRGDDVLLRRVRALATHTPPWTMALVYTRQLPLPALLLSFGRMGVEQLACTDSESDPRVGLLALIEALSLRMELEHLIHLLSTQLDNVAVPIVVAALSIAQAPSSTALFAALCGLTERTLSRRCDFIGLRSPSWVRSWARALVAAYRISERRILPETAATQLGYRTVAALYAELRRHGFEFNGAGASNTPLRTTLAASLQLLRSRSGSPPARRNFRGRSAWPSPEF